MKALNRAIARTVSQLARYGGDEFHPLMKHALVQHLSMLLAMERKQLEQAGMKFATLTGDGAGEALPAININSAGCTGHVDAKAVAAHLMRGLKRSRVSGGIIASSTPQENGRTAWERYLDSGVVSNDLIKGLGLKREDGPEFAVPNERAGRPDDDWAPGEADRFAAQFAQKWSPQAAASFNNLTAEQEPPSLPLSQWMAGDRIFFVGSAGWGFTNGKAYEIIHINMLNGFATIKYDAGNEREFGPGPWLNASFRNYSRRTDERADVEANAAKVPVEPGLHIEVGDVLTRTSGGQLGVWTFGADYTVMAVAADGDVTVYDDSHYPRVMSAGVVRSNFTVGKKRVEPAEQAQPAPDAKPAPAYQVGDMLEYAGESGEYFTRGNLYPVSAVSTSRQYPVYVIDDEGDEHGLRKCLPEFINRGQPAPQPAPDAIDMTDPANWQEGDIVLRTGQDWAGFLHGREYRVAKVNALKQEIYINRNEGNTTGYTFDLLRDDKMFTWLRHGDTA